MQTLMEKPHIQIANMSRWYVVSRALHTVARLGIANFMSHEPLAVEEIARASGTQPLLLERLLDFLCAYQIFRKNNQGYALTELSQVLRDDDEHSMRDVLSMVDDSWWQAFSDMETSIQQGTPAFELQHGTDFFAFLGENPQKQQNFDRGMARISTFDIQAIVNAYDFSSLNTLVDMGGGRGGLAQAISQKYPKLHTTVFDSQAVISQLRPEEYNENVSLQAGNFFAQIPNADAYFFKGVLHDFNDETMFKIVQNCAQQMPRTSRLLIAEQVLPEDDAPHPNKTMDVVMMVLLGGRQRSLSGWQQAVAQAGFVLKNTYPTASLFTLMEFILP